MTQVDIEEYRRGVLADISDIEKDNMSSEFPVEKFTEYVSPLLAEAGYTSDLAIGHIERQFGSGLIHCDAWAADLTEGRLDIVVTDYSGHEFPDPITKSRLENTCKRAVRVIEFAKKTCEKDIEPSSKTFDCVSLIRESLGAVNQLRLHYLTDAVISSRDDPVIEPPEGLEIQLHKWDIVRLSRLQSSDHDHVSIKLDLLKRYGRGLPCLPMQGNSEEYSGYLAILPGSWLADLYEEYAGQLMELNVRSFLQQKGKVNKGIRKTILEEPSRFLAYNNGISATVESIETERLENGQEVITHLAGLQVVNGGQTVASIHRSQKADRCQHLDKVAVQAKITVVKPELLDDLVPQISRYSNTQNNVNEADFASNDSFHVDVQRLANTVWAPGQRYKWFYERARGEYQVARSRFATTPARRRKFDEMNPPRMKFVKTDLARYQNAWDQKPHVVGLGTQKNFIDYMTSVKQEAHTFSPDVDYFKDLIAKAIIYKKAESISRKHAFPAYRANAVAYTVALLSQKTFGRLVLRNIWDRQAVTPIIEEVIYDWMPEVLQCITETANGRNVTEWAKKEECWIAVKSLDLPIPEQLESELSEGDRLPTVGSDARRGRVSITTEDRKNIALVMGIPSDTWWKITKWGQSNQDMPDFKCGIANTMAGYAVAGWVKVPSAKQAKHAAGIIRELTDSGVLLTLDNSIAED